MLLTTTQPLEALKEPLAQVRANTSGAAAFASLRWSVLSRAENRGADIGRLGVLRGVFFSVVFYAFELFSRVSFSHFFFGPCSCRHQLGQQLSGLG